ncbi:MAG: hypothetical protein COV46_02850 [Deltaproteobacteria bacterium CG11_big_fil_rev_8_21_14_0_20_49_13]|nr:MAG: hypothetical protein COV46_02850 [Deltaproteobacteria bacterium CG11_big_fil_rev_8_21_14_0_20_49_13]
MCVCVAGHTKSKEAAIKKLFDHQMHTDNFFTPSDVPCETCHVNDQYEWKNMDRQGCHKCHNAKEPIMPATDPCTMCHDKYRVKPANHKVNWRLEHKTPAQANSQECRACHKERFCIKCHEERNYIMLDMHKRNYKYFHSIDARLDPKKCDRCHTVSYCTSCHTNPRIK